MSLLYAAGPTVEMLNLLARVPSGYVTCNPAEDSDYPLAKAYDGGPWGFRFGSIAADSYVQLRNNCLENPGAEVALGDEWVDASTGTGTFARSPVDAGRGGAGTYAFRVNGGAAGVGRGYQRLECPAGELGRVDGWCLPGLAQTGQIRLYCEETAQWYVAGAWQAAEGDCVTVTNIAAYTRVATTTLQLPTLATVLEATVHIRIYLRTADNGNVDWDDIAWIPAVNGVAAIGNNWRPALTPTLRYSDDAFGGDDNEAAEITLRRPSCYAYLSTAIYREYWRVKLGDTNTEAPRATELVITYLTDPSRGPADGWRMIPQPLVAQPADPYLPYRSRIADDGAVRIEVDFSTWDGSAWRTLLNDVDKRTARGHGPLLVIPSTVALEAPVVYGRADSGELDMQRNGGLWAQRLVVHGMRVPRATT